MLGKKPTILIVDDTETNIDILLDLLSDYDIAVAIDGHSALEIAHEEQPDMILLDIMMPEMDGYEVCQRLKSKSKTEDIPVIFITAKTDEDSIEKAYEIGGVDYVTKPFKPRELLARVKTQIKLKDLIDSLELMASSDFMTGIHNRRKFFELAHERFYESKDNLYAVIIDIDNFKKINDTYGHPVGDEVIKTVARTIDRFLLDDTIFARIGGEEFAILSYCHSEEKMVEDIDGIRKRIEKLEVIIDDEVKISCTISNGIAKAREDMNTLDSLLKEADKALYEAKGDGRNKVIFR